MKKYIAILLLIPAVSSVITVWSCSSEKKEDPLVKNIPDTLLSGIPKQIYLWESGNVPATTEYTINNHGYFDPPDFRPNMVYFPAYKTMEVKGAVLICPGGAFQFRSNNEGAPIAQYLSSLGYQSFVVNYRLRPYTMQEGALDLALAVRYVRSHAKDLGIEENEIVVMGFPAGPGGVYVQFRKIALSQ
jgi:hypothetical protein